MKHWILLLALILTIGCGNNKDETKDKAILAFVLDCRGLSTTACQDTCNGICGVGANDALTPSTVTCVYNCKTSCTTSCNLLTLLTTLNRKPWKWFPMEPASKTLPDCYKVLDLPFGSTGEEIKKQYRLLAKTFHPDNLRTGCKEKFQEIHNAYAVLTGGRREKYDILYKSLFLREKDYILIPQERVVYANTMTELAKRGLLRSGLRKRDRHKFYHVHHDLDILIKSEESKKKVYVRIPLVVRILCPDCMGSNLYCEVCGGIGNYKSSRVLQVCFEPNLLQNGRIFELELSRFRPDKFIHFKKKFIRIRVNIIESIPASQWIPSRTFSAKSIEHAGYPI